MTTSSRLQQRMIGVLGGVLLVMGGAFVGVGCEHEGPVEAVVHNRLRKTLCRDSHNMDTAYAQVRTLYAIP